MKRYDLKDENLLERIIDSHPSLRELISIFNEIHKKGEHRFFFVGGFVRDLLLGRCSTDIDVAVEGPLEPIIEAIDHRIDSDYVYYERFQTATLSLEELQVDLTCCRKESYAKDGALPDIIPGTFEDDIWRRDFTINAIAIDLSCKEKFSVYAPPLAMSDLKEGQIRCLHKRSFWEDPTRIFRAIRYMCRLDFHMEEETGTLIEKALKDGALNCISSDRIFTEICKDLKEDSAYAILNAHQHWGVDQYIAKNLRLPEKLCKDLEALNRLEVKFIEDTESFDPCKLRLLAIFHHNQDRAQDFIGAFHLSNRFSNMLSSMKSLTKEINKTTCNIDNAQIYRRLEDVQDEVLLVLYVCSENKDVRCVIKRYYTEIKNVVNPVRGSDILQIGVPPGPQVRAILDQVMDAYLNGEVKTKKEALLYAKTCIKR